ncbi:MAG TPA: monovalent cation/H(+) antiporter subunit G [Longimicrobiales bacterium]|nr:monovalent cation/H(+) antiporter subunit G [Longimicrobiales bacterium]
MTEFLLRASDLVLDGASIVLLVTGSFFFLAGTVGVLRFPDVLTRLHALTKADTLGLGFVVLGLCIRTELWSVRVQLLVIWVIVLVSTATVAHLLARTALESRPDQSRADQDRTDRNRTGASS